MFPQQVGDFFRMGLGDCPAATAKVFDRLNHRLGHLLVGLSRSSDEIKSLTLRDSFVSIFTV
jgi:hypothetical protein